ncbi:glycoside hydrolase family protein [Stenotrophomonas maltophilia]|uniref:Glycoside hydrolase family protein n=2 Tax=Stenotrophomonas TaxID=40323 RepID=A0AA40Y033_STEMA|nr:glycoside hydrolase family protein [Stenotrophomonas geniculata]MBH1639160.1 glycoside hydrolase family protein [Stenotrophomonas maltophilia]MCI1065162.1 glycoside hydrolase family protein [Stenotrophomonas maltophilia]MCI1106282.1 glycoside hydrolase family protein [Stenotrophomonas maltophilia]
MLAWSEGTGNGKQATTDRGYDVIVGGQLFKSYADHSRVLVDLPKHKIQSTAAGRYQLLRRYYDAYKKTLGLKDFMPLSQDLIALQQFREAVERGYDSVESCASYYSSGVTRYRAEALAMVAWRDAVNQALEQLVLAPPEGIETWDQVRALLPQSETFA